MKNHLLMLKQLDRQLKDWRLLANHSQLSKTCWIRTIRKALGMTAEQLAQRLHLQRGRINQLEFAETHGAVTLRALKAAAQAMDCELIYALVPRHPLEETIKAKAVELAKKQLKHVKHSMALENQAVEGSFEKEQIEALVNNILNSSLKNLWGK